VQSISQQQIAGRIGRRSKVSLEILITLNFQAQNSVRVSEFTFRRRGETWFAFLGIQTENASLLVDLFRAAKAKYTRPKRVRRKKKKIFRKGTENVPLLHQDEFSAEEDHFLV